MKSNLLTIDAMRSAIRNGTVSAELLAIESLDHVIKNQDRLKAFVHIDEKRVLDEAKHLDRQATIGVPKQSLHGIPIAIKDIIHVSGWPTGGGSLTRRGAELPKRDALIVSRLRNAGAVIIGKSATVEYAFGGWGSNETLGAPMNPWDLVQHRVPGGSSNGSGVAVAAGLVPGAIGSDTGGSIRLPSSFSGMVGLKTTAGLIPTTGVLPLSDMLDTLGPMTRTVRDAAILFDAMADYEEGTSEPSDIDGSKAFQSIRIGVPENLGVALHPDTEVVWKQTQALIAACGGSLVPIRFPMSLAEYAAPCGMFLAVDGYRHYGSFAEEEPNRMGDPVRQRILTGKAVRAVDYANNLMRRSKEKQVIAKVFDAIDALLMPSTAFPAPVMGEHPEHDSPGVFTRFANYFDLAAISLPAGVTPSGLPVGMQFVVPGFQETRAIDVAYRFETANGGPIFCPYFKDAL